MRHLGIPRGVCDPCGHVGEWGCEGCAVRAGSRDLSQLKEGCPVVLVRKVVEYDSGGAVGVECDSEEVGKGSVSPRVCAAEADFFTATLDANGATRIVLNDLTNQ